MTCRPCPRPATLPEKKKTPGRWSPGRKGIVPMSDSTTRAHDLETLRPMTAQEVADLTGWPRPAVLRLLAAGNGEEAASA